MTTTNAQTVTLQKALEIEKSGTSVCVRLTGEQHRRLKRDAEFFGKSIPTLLREVYFRGPMMSPLLAKADEHAIMVALRRIGNNLNQIARQVNLGVAAGFNSEFAACRDQFEAMNTFFRRFALSGSGAMGGLALGDS